MASLLLLRIIVQFQSSGLDKVWLTAIHFQRSMDLQSWENTLSTSAKTSTDEKSWIATVAIGFVILMPTMGLFFPPETYFSFQGDTLAAQESLGTLPLTQFIMRLSWVIAVFWLIRNGRSYLPEAKYSFLLLLQVTGFCLSVFWSDDFIASGKSCFDYLVTIIFTLYIVHNYSPKQFVALFTQLSAIAAIASFGSLVFFPALAHNLGSATYAGVLRGAFVQKNVLGQMSSLAILTALYSWFVRANSRVLSGFVVAASTVLLVGSDSITSITTTAIGVLLFVVAYLCRSAIGRVLLVLLALSTSLVIIAFVMNVDSLTSAVGRSSGLTGRTALWFAVERMIALRPLHGYGLGFWRFSNSQDRDNMWLAVGWAAPEAHRDILDVLLQTGLVGATFYVINTVVALFLGFRRFGHLYDGSIYCLALLLLFLDRSYSETVTMVPAQQELIVFVAQAYLYKLSFARQSRAAQTERKINMPVNLKAIS